MRALGCPIENFLGYLRCRKMLAIFICHLLSNTWGLVYSALAKKESLPEYSHEDIGILGF